MTITDVESRILLAASNLVTMRAPGQGSKQEQLVEATINIYKMLKEELEKIENTNKLFVDAGSIKRVVN